MEGATTIPSGSTRQATGKRRASRTDDDIVSTAEQSVAARKGGECVASIPEGFDSVLFEDRSSRLALDSIRSFHTDDAGFALAKQVDTDVAERARVLQGGTDDATYDAAVIGSDGSTAYIGTNEDAISDAGLRTCIQTLDDADVPQSQRYLVIPPVSKNTILGLARFTEQAFVGEVGMANSIRNGRIGNIYGIEVLVSTNCATATGAARIAILMHRSAIALAEAIDVRVQTQYMQEYLGTLLTADALYGTAELRDDAGIAIAVAA